MEMAICILLTGLRHTELCLYKSSDRIAHALGYLWMSEVPAHP